MHMCSFAYGQARVPSTLVHFIITLTICFIVCDSLSNPAGGAVSITCSTATYSCNNGYNLIGNDTMTCQSNGYWSGQPPICEG